MTIGDKPDTLSLTSNKMAATHFTPDAVNSQKRGSRKVGLLQHHKTDHHSTTTTEGTIFKTQKDLLPTVGLC